MKKQQLIRTNGNALSAMLKKHRTQCPDWREGRGGTWNGNRPLMSLTGIKDELGGGGGLEDLQSEDIRVMGFEQAATILDDITALAQRVRENAVGKSGLTQMP